jgi:hypothetical protein
MIRTCTHADCDKPARSATSPLCKMHYHRMYRHGTVERVATQVRTGPGRRYRSAHRPGHPLAMANGKVYVHRAVLFDAIGPGVHPCNWCRSPVAWDATRGDPRMLSVDHLNGEGDDNRPENLVPACSTCNATRGAQNRHRALKAIGWWSNHDTISRLSAGGRRTPIG